MAQCRLKLAYAALYCESTEEVADHLHRLIAGQLCGFDEGTAMWHAALSAMLQQPDALASLAATDAFRPATGAPLSTAQWRQALQMLQLRLEADTGATGAADAT